MNIRAMTASDRSAVLDLISATAMFLPEEEQVAAEVIDIYLANADQKDYVIEVVEDSAGQVAGYVCYGPTPMTEGTVDLYWMAVHPEKHRQGYGRALVQRVEQTTRAQNGRLIVIETSAKPMYSSTRQFYRQTGYIETARLPDFYRDGEDLVIFCKHLNKGGT